MGLAQQHAAVAIHERAKAGLDNAKALKEIDEMGDKRLMNLADFILSIQERQQALQRGEEDAQLVAKAQSDQSVEAANSQTAVA